MAVGREAEFGGPGERETAPGHVGLAWVCKLDSR